MSFGFGVSDFVHLLKVAKEVADACRNGPEHYREICSEARALRNTLLTLHDEAKEEDSLLNSKGAARKQELVDVIASCTQTFEQAQTLIDKHSKLEKNGSNDALARVWHSYRAGRADMEVLTGRMTFYIVCITAFRQSLEGSAITRIERKVDQLYEKIMAQDEVDAKDYDGSISIISSAESLRSRLETDTEDVWTELKVSLEAENLPASCLASYKDEVVAYLKSKFDAAVQTSGPTNEQTQEILLPSEPSLGSGLADLKTTTRPQHTSSTHKTCLQLNRSGWYCSGQDTFTHSPKDAAQRLNIGHMSCELFINGRVIDSQSLFS